VQDDTYNSILDNKTMPNNPSRFNCNNAAKTSDPTPDISDRLSGYKCCDDNLVITSRVATRKNQAIQALLIDVMVTRVVTGKITMGRSKGNCGDHQTAALFSIFLLFSL
jgi:hypothetical protein